MKQSPISPQLAANLFVFEFAVRRRSFTNAAAELNITQSAVSQRIARLEKALGVALLIRRGGALELTTDGREIYQLLAPLYEQLSKTFATIGRPDAQAALTLSCCPSLAREWLAPSDIT